MKVSTGGSHLDRYIWFTLSLKEAIEMQKLLAAAIYETASRNRESKQTMNYNDDSGYPEYLNEFELVVKP